VARNGLARPETRVTRQTYADERGRSDGSVPSVLCRRRYSRVCVQPGPAPPEHRYTVTFEPDATIATLSVPRTSNPTRYTWDGGSQGLINSSNW